MSEVLTSIHIQHVCFHRILTNCLNQSKQHNLFAGLYQHMHFMYNSYMHSLHLGIPQCKGLQLQASRVTSSNSAFRDLFENAVICEIFVELKFCSRTYVLAKYFACLNFVIGSECRN